MKESIESLKRPDHSTEATEITHPSFEVWQSNTSIDNCWCLNISRSPGQEPITVRGLQNLRGTVEFIKGFLEIFGEILCQRQLVLLIVTIILIATAAISTTTG